MEENREGPHQDLRYADGAMLVSEIEEELKSLLIEGERGVKKLA